MMGDAKTRLLTLTREAATCAGGTQTELGCALDELADKFESLVRTQSDAERLLEEARFANSTWARIQDIRGQVELKGLPQSEVEENLRRHAILWVRHRLVSEESRAAYDTVILKIGSDFRRA